MNIQSASSQIEDQDEVTSVMWGTSLPSQIDAMSYIKDGSSPVPMRMSDDNIAIVRIQGIMSKNDNDYGLSTPQLSAKVRRAVAEDARGIMVYVDSPGGNTAGLAQLMDDIAAATEKIPVFSFIEDVGASAAYFAICQSTRIIAGQTAFVGALGTYIVVRDTSKEEADAGSVVNLFSTGEFKGAGTPGTAVTDAHKAHFQSQVDEVGRVLFEKLENGMRRRLASNRNRFTLGEVTNGKMFVGEQALKVGLVDGIGTFDSAYKELLSKVGGELPPEQRPKRSKAIEPPKREVAQINTSSKHVSRGAVVNDRGLSLIF